MPIVDLDNGIAGSRVPHVFEVSSSGAASALFLNTGDIVIRLDQGGATYVWDGLVLKPVGGSSSASPLTVAATITTSITLTNNCYTPVNAAGGPLTETLPTGQVQGSLIVVEKVDSSTNVVTISGNIRGVSSSTITLALSHEAIDFVADSTGSWWPNAGHKTLGSLDARYDAAGAAAAITSTVETFATNADTTVLATAETFATAAVSTETTRATNAEATKAPIASPTFTGVASSPVFKATGLTGAVAASRYVGATATGAPTTGTFVVGDWVADQTGKFWLCTVAGSPGTWVSAGSTSPISTVFGRTGAIVSANGDYAVGQVTGAAPSNNPTFTGIVSAPEYTATGLGSATAASRYVGATSSGAPISGTFAIGDWIVDQTGKIWICTSAGTPGSWGVVGTSPVSSIFGRSGAVVATSGDYSVSQVTGAAPINNPTFTGTTTAPEFSASGLTGATAATRYVGGTVSGAPASGTFVTGDWIVDQTAKIWICTAGGTPGTWGQVSSGGAVSSVFGRAGAIIQVSGDYNVGQVSGAAPIASPTFTGIVTLGSTAPASDNSLKAASTAYVTAAIAASSSSVVATTQSGTTYTFVLADGGTVVEFSNAAAITATVPPNSSVAYPIGTIIEGFQLGTGQITFSPGAGVTFDSPGGLVHSATQYSTVSLRKRGTNEWVLAGNLS